MNESNENEDCSHLKRGDLSEPRPPFSSTFLRIDIVSCVTSASAHQVRLEWPTDLAVNPMDNSLYVLENNVILRITENHQVCTARLHHYH